MYKCLDFISYIHCKFIKVRSLNDDMQDGRHIEKHVLDCLLLFLKKA